MTNQEKDNSCSHENKNDNNDFQWSNPHNHGINNANINFDHNCPNFNSHFHNEHIHRHMHSELKHNPKEMRDFERMKREHMRRHKLMHRRVNELYFLNRYMHIFRKFTLIITIVILLFMFKVMGFKVATVIIAGILVINEFTIIYMITRLEKRFVSPMAKLQDGVKKISEGDYSIRLEEDLENEVGILTREFNRMAKKLEASEKIKSEYEQNRKELIANISHDLKTPITSINGYVEGLLEDVVPKNKVNNYLKTIRSNASYMNKLIDDLFLFSKLDMQKLEFNFSKVNIKDYIYDIIEEFNFILEEKGIKFNYKDDISKGVDVKIDGKRLYRSIRNLLDNAMKYGGENDELKIEIALYDNEDFIYIDVSDNGPGIEKEKLNSIFQRFYRVDKERTKDLNSTGLGLAIAKEIIEAHSGKISVDSEVNVGTTFTIKLPKLAQEEEKQSES